MAAVNGKWAAKMPSIDRIWEIFMRALVAIVLSATAIVAGATSAAAADLSYVPKRQHVRHAPESCSPCEVGWRSSPPVAYVAYRLEHGPWAPKYHHWHHRWAGGCHIGPRPCHQGVWRKRGIAGHVAPGRYQLVRQKDYLREPVLVVVNDDYAYERHCAARCRW